jgi:SAM-dependent methyltransferase
VSAGRRLPFDDIQFDIVFSNAVIEHVGGPSQQRAFVGELCRVARQVFIATPNRWFPVEHHTGLPLVHYLPRPAFRSLLRRTPFSYWSHEEHLRILDAEELRSLFSPARSVRVERAGVGAGLFASNLIAYAGDSESQRR